MPLPTLKIIEQKVTLPDSGKEITVRPYLTGEEKGLLIALESNDEKTMRNAIKNLIESCVIGKTLKVDDLSSLDIEFLFVQLRKISVSNIVKIQLFHDDEKSECKHAQEVEVHLDKYVITDAAEKKILLDEDQHIGIVMKTPTVSIFESLDNTKSQTSKTFDLIYSCVDYIYDQEEVYRDFTKEELKGWVDRLTESQFQKIMNFFDKIPKMQYKIEYECSACKKKETRTIEGLLNFLL